jgi:hypothetical protein
MAFETVYVAEQLEVPVGEPIELLALAVKDLAIRCKVLTNGIPVTFKKVRWEVEGEILTVIPSKVWRFKSTNYMSGEVINQRIDVPALNLQPLKLEQIGVWDPEQEIDPEKNVWSYLEPVIALGLRPTFRMERVPLGLNDDSDPILEADEYFGCGADNQAYKIMENILTADLRCIEAHLHLGKFDLERCSDRPDCISLDKAIKHFEVGVKIGEQVIGVDFTGVLPWSEIDNRPFLRCLHGYGVCLWRQGKEEKARDIFLRMLHLNPDDQQDACMMLEDVDEGGEPEGSFV